MVAVKTVGIRELKLNPGKIIRLVRDSQEPIDLTIRGEVVARLVPVGGNQYAPPADAKTLEQKTKELADYWRRHAEISAEISRNWPEGVSALDAINDVRREL